MFDYYCAQNGGMIEGNAAFAIGQNSYSKFIADAGLHDEKLTVETTSRIFVEVNVETQKGTIEADLNEDRGLTRFELLETFVRFATTKYEGRIADVSDAVAKFVAEDLGPKLPKVATFDRDDFRRDRLYNRETDRMLRTHLAPLKALYALYGPSEGGKPTFNLGSLRRLKFSAALGTDETAAADARARERAECARPLEQVLSEAALLEFRVESPAIEPGPI